MDRLLATPSTCNETLRYIERKARAKKTSIMEMKSNLSNVEYNEIHVQIHRQAVYNTNTPFDNQVYELHFHISCVSPFAL